MEIIVFATIVLIATLVIIWLESLSKKSDRTDKKMDEIGAYLEKIRDLKKNMIMSRVLTLKFSIPYKLNLKF